MRAAYAANPEPYKARSYAYKQKNAERLRLDRASIGGRARLLLNNARQRARKASLPFDLTREWIEARISRGFCEVTGLAFTLAPDAPNAARNPFAPSLDRRQPKDGYTKANVSVVVWIHNTARQDWGDAPVRRYAEALCKMT